MRFLLLTLVGLPVSPAAAPNIGSVRFVPLQIAGLGRYGSEPAVFLQDPSGGQVMPVPIPRACELAFEQALSPTIPARVEVLLQARTFAGREGGLVDSLPWEWVPSPLAKRDLYARLSGRDYPMGASRPASAYHLLLDAFILFAALLGNVTALVQTFDKGNAQKREKITTLHQFNASRKVPAVLQRKLFAYVDAEWTITSGLDDSNVLAQLPGQLRGNIVASIYKDNLLKSPLFSACSLECAKALLLRLQPEICLQKEVLIARDQLCQEVYLLMRGAMQVASADGDDKGATSTSRKPALMFRMIEKQGSIIGHIDPFQREVPRYPFLVTAVRQAHLVSLSRVDVLDVLGSAARAALRRTPAMGEADGVMGAGRGSARSNLILKSKR